MKRTQSESGGDSHVSDDLEPVGTYVDAIYQAHNKLTDADRSVVERLAMFRRLIDFHMDRLGDDPGNVFSTDQLQKLSAQALRHEEALNINRKKTEPDSPDKPNRPGSIRRNE